MSTTETVAPHPFLERFRACTPSIGYLLLGLPLSLLAVLGASLLVGWGVGLLVLVIGLPVLAAGALWARFFAERERDMQRRLLGRDVPGAVYATSGEGSIVKRSLAVLRDPQSWWDQLWTLVHVLISSLTFPVLVTWLVGAAGTVLGPIATLVLERVLGAEHDAPLGWLGIDSIPANLAVEVVLGLFFVLTLPAVAMGLARWQARLVDGMLNQRSRTLHEMGALRATRDAARVAEADQLRRLERDIHDGPQQRLVRLGIDLARARRLAATDPERAETVIAGAMEQTAETLGELRMLSRGIAPPLLVDRGLDAAVTELAGRSVVPVRVTGGVRRFPGHVETAAYYVVSECLANINKHAGASTAEVHLAAGPDELVITVRDDGCGGADPAKGHGLAGLADRVRSVDGRLEVDSPAGGPTVVQAVLPCAS